MKLTDKEIIEGNKLIAEFRFKRDEIGLNCSDWNLTHKNYISPEHCLFHLSWDWLMPIVEKIENLPITNNGGICVLIEHNYCKIYLDDWGEITDIAIGISKVSKLDATFKAIIDFIKWYNVNK